MFYFFFTYAFIIFKYCSDNVIIITKYSGLTKGKNNLYGHTF